jgi:mono/diheme cytochrome c family protein
MDSCRKSDPARLLKLAGCFLVLSLLIAASSAKAAWQEATLPEGPGREIATRNCLSCHGAEPIVQQRLARPQWQAEVEKMIRWGADVDPAAKDRLIDYFVAHFGSKRTIPPKQTGEELPDGPGLLLVRDNCLSCHGHEPIVQQRLGRPQWTAEVDKMIRWGADVPADKKDALIDYLAEHFPSAR